MATTPSSTDLQTQPRLLAILRLNAALLVVVAAMSPFFFVSVLRALPADLEADHRLAPTFGLVHGYRLYYPPDSGPVLSTLYGPVTALFYLPATIASTPMAAIAIGTVWAMLVFFAASLATVRVATGESWMKWWQLLALAVGLVWLIGPVERTASHIHADAPALLFAAMACVFAMREQHRLAAWENELLAAMFGVLAMFSKQNLVPAVVGLAIWFALRGRRALLRFVAFAILFAALISVFTVTVLSSPAAFVFNCITMPMHQPLDKSLLFPLIGQMCVLSLALLLIPLGRLLKAWIGWEADLRTFLLQRKASLLIVVGMLMVPAAIAGRMKIGGNENSLGLALYFFILALMTEIAAKRTDNSIETKLWSLPVLLACVVSMLPAVYLSAKSRPPSPMQQAYLYATQHPGQVYFPQFPLVHLMAEGKLYHFSWGLTDRRNAGFPVSDEHFRKYVPATAEVMAVSEFEPQFEADMTSRQGPRDADFAGASQLRRFEFFAMPPASRQNNEARP